MNTTDTTNAIQDQIDNKSIQLLSILQSGNLTIQTIESMTGGLLSNQLTNIAGYSKYNNGSLVVYSDRAKNTILGLETCGANMYSELFAEQMVLCARNKIKANLYVSVTGNADPYDNVTMGIFYVAMLLEGKLSSSKFDLNHEIRSSSLYSDYCRETNHDLKLKYNIKIRQYIKLRAVESILNFVIVNC